VSAPTWHVVVVAWVRDYRGVGWSGPVGEIARNTLQISVRVVGERRQGLVVCLVVVSIAEAVIVTQILGVVPVDPLEVGHLLPAPLLHNSEHPVSSLVIGCGVHSVVPYSWLITSIPILVQEGASWGRFLII